jgi:hypothetical protein
MCVPLIGWYIRPMNRADRALEAWRKLVWIRGLGSVPMVLLLLPLVVPLLVIAGWLTALRWYGLPRWVFLGCCAALPVLCLVMGSVAGSAEDRRLPFGCGDGTLVGLECGFGIGRLAGYLGAFTATATLALLAVVSLIVRKVRSRRYRGLPALTRDE